MVFLKFLLAHFLGDFLFQTDKLVKDKEQKKIKSPYLYAHIGIHTLCLFLVFWFDLNYIGGILFVMLSHFIIDVLKLYLQTDKNKRIVFFIDQLLHLIMLVLATFLYQDVSIDLNSKQLEKLLFLGICVLFVTYVSSIIIRVIIQQWNPDKDNAEQSLAEAGKYIGFLERLLVFVFIVIGRWEGVGFLLTAKSVFRYGDLSESKNRKLTEYVLIGTLLSFSLAIIAGLVYSYYGR